MESYKGPKDYYSSSAPEVTPLTIPERACEHHEDPQPVHYYNQNGTSMPYYGPRAILDKKSQPGKHSKKTIILSILGALAALAVGMGIGIGIGISVEKNSYSVSGHQVLNRYGRRPQFLSHTRGLMLSSTESTLIRTTTPSATVTSTSSNPSSILTALNGVATGATSGLGSYSCSNGTQIQSSSEVTYILDCNAAYLTGGPDLYQPNSIIANVSEPPYTRYNIIDCIDLCDRWNIYPDHDTIPCRTVTYYANLTQAYGDDWMGNCFLKSGRPEYIARSGNDGIDWEHTVSAYMSCLVNGAC